jgi:hypothetical protein
LNEWTVTSVCSWTVDVRGRAYIYSLPEVSGAAETKGPVPAGVSRPDGQAVDHVGDSRGLAGLCGATMGIRLYILRAAVRGSLDSRPCRRTAKEGSRARDLLLRLD